MLSITCHPRYAFPRKSQRRSRWKAKSGLQTSEVRLAHGPERRRYLLTCLCIITAWISYLQTAVLIGTLALALFNASKDQIARNFAYAYAILSIAVTVRTCRWTTSIRFIKSLISWLVQIYGYAVYQHRITMIRRRDPGNFGASGRSTGTLKPYVLHFTTLTDQITGPVLISAFLFFAVLANFIIRGEFDQIVDYMRDFGDTY